MKRNSRSSILSKNTQADVGGVVNKSLTYWIKSMQECSANICTNAILKVPNFIEIY
jgi:hypothetical protein